MSLTYRKATIADIDCLVDLRMDFLAEANGGRSNSEAALRSEIRAYLNRHMPNGSFAAWVCVDDRAIVGTSGISFYELPATYNNPSGKVGYIMNMYTKPVLRRRGIASKLFRAVLDEGIRAHVGKVQLHATTAGRPLYQKFGLVAQGDEMVLVGDRLRG